MRVVGVMRLACILRNAAIAMVASIASASAADPLLGRPPYPSGFISPGPIPQRVLGIGSTVKNAPILCLLFDVGIDGNVSNVRMLQSTGLPDDDAAILAWWGTKRYEPATINGQPIAVRMLGRYTLGPGPFNENCSWDLYDAQIKAPAPMPTQPSP